MYEVNPDGHKQVMEFVEGNVLESQEFELEKDLIIGTNQSGEFIIDMSVADFITKVGSFNDYTIQIYDQYEGHRKLIVSGTFNWF